LEEMERGSLVDYLLASAALPGFQRPRIAGKEYADGGLYDNVPYEMARKRGYRRIIVSDVSGAGRNRRPQIEGSVTVYVKASIEMGGLLDFDREFLDAYNLLGYLDTMRAFGRLDGYSYFLKPDPRAEKAFGAGTRSVPAGRRGSDRDFPDYMRYDRRGLLKRLECAAAALDIERVRAYSYAELEAAIRERAAAVEARVEAERGAMEGILRLAAPIREAITARKFEECPLYYYRLVEEALPGRSGSLLKKALVAHCPELPAGAAWLESQAAPARKIEINRP